MDALAVEADADADAEASAAAPPTECVCEAPLMLDLPAGVARPICLTAELLDADGTVLASAATLTLALSPGGETSGTLVALPLLPPGCTEASPTVSYYTLSLSYEALEQVEPADPSQVVPQSSPEDLAGICASEVVVGELVPAFAGVCVRSVEREMPPAPEEPLEPPPPDPKKKGKNAEPEPEPEPAGPLYDRYPVACESGRQLSVILKLPAEAIEKRAADAAAAAEEAQAAWEAEQAAAAEEHAAAVAEAEAAGAEPPEPLAEAESPAPPPPPEEEWVLGSAATSDGRLLMRGLRVPLDAPSGPATLHLVELTPPVSLFELPMFAEVQLPIVLKPIPGTEPEEPPPDPKAKKK